MSSASPRQVGGCGVLTGVPEGVLFYNMCPWSCWSVFCVVGKSSVVVCVLKGVLAPFKKKNGWLPISGTGVPLTDLVSGLWLGLLRLCDPRNVVAFVCLLWMSLAGLARSLLSLVELARSSVLCGGL